VHRTVRQGHRKHSGAQQPGIRAHHPAAVLGERAATCIPDRQRDGQQGEQRQPVDRAQTAEPGESERAAQAEGRQRGDQHRQHPRVAHPPVTQPAAQGDQLPGAEQAGGDGGQGVDGDDRRHGGLPERCVLRRKSWCRGADRGARGCDESHRAGANRIRRARTAAACGRRNGHGPARGPCRGRFRAGTGGGAQRGRSLRPIRKVSTSRAHWRPSRIAHTTSDWPRRMSPAAKTFGTLVA